MISMNLELNKKTALISGSTKGIGFAAARQLAAEGAYVIVNGRTDKADTTRNSGDSSRSMYSAACASVAPIFPA